MSPQASNKRQARPTATIRVRHTAAPDNRLSLPIDNIGARELVHVARISASFAAARSVYLEKADRVAGFEEDGATRVGAFVRRRFFDDSRDPSMLSSLIVANCHALRTSSDICRFRLTLIQPSPCTPARCE